jgi:hypothetical protein
VSLGGPLPVQNLLDEWQGGRTDGNELIGGGTLPVKSGDWISKYGVHEVLYRHSV